MTNPLESDNDEWRTKYLHVPEDKAARNVRIGIALLLWFLAVVMAVKAVTAWLALA